MAENKSTLSGLTPGEAQEFHALFMQSTIAYVLVAVVAHILVWLWRPWVPGPKGYAALESTVTTITSMLA
jgi:light-harvesting complex 1 beta chain